MTAKRIDLDDQGAQVGDTVFIAGKVFEAREGSNVRLIEMTRRAFIRTKDGYDFVDPIPMLVAFFVEEVWQQVKQPPFDEETGGPFTVEAIAQRWSDVPTWHTGPAASKDIRWLIGQLEKVRAAYQAAILDDLGQTHADAIIVFAEAKLRGETT
jgi:hypothetical protein